MSLHALSARVDACPVPQFLVRRVGWSGEIPGLSVIELRGAIVAGRRGPKGASEVARVSHLLAQVRAARKGGSKAILLVIDSPGGCPLGALRLYQALVGFQKAGGLVVVYVDRQAASAAIYPALAGQLRLIGPGGSFRVHSARSTSRRSVAYWNRSAVLFCSKHTRTPLAELWRWTALSERRRGSPIFAELGSPAALAYGWSDLEVTGMEEAREVAGIAMREQARRQVPGEHLAPKRRAPGAACPMVAVLSVRPLLAPERS